VTGICRYQPRDFTLFNVLSRFSALPGVAAPVPGGSARKRRLLPSPARNEPSSIRNWKREEFLGVRKHKLFFETLKKVTAIECELGPLKKKTKRKKVNPLIRAIWRRWIEFVVSSGSACGSYHHLLQPPYGLKAAASKANHLNKVADLSETTTAVPTICVSLDYWQSPSIFLPFYLCMSVSLSCCTAVVLWKCRVTTLPICRNWLLRICVTSSSADRYLIAATR